MTWPVSLGDVRIILRPLVLIVDKQADRRPGGAPLERAGENAHLVGFAALGGETAGAGAPLVEPRLDVGFGQRQPWRAAVDDRADGRAVAFTPGGEPEQPSERVEAHRLTTTKVVSLTSRSWTSRFRITSP